MLNKREELRINKLRNIFEKFNKNNIIIKKIKI